MARLQPPSVVAAAAVVDEAVGAAADAAVAVDADYWVRKVVNVDGKD